MDWLTNPSGTLSDPFSAPSDDSYASFGGSLSFISSREDPSTTASAGGDEGEGSWIGQEEESEPAEDEFATIDLFSAKTDSSTKEAAAKGEPLPPAPWTAEEDAQLLHLDKTLRSSSSSSSSSSTSTPSIDWVSALPFFPGRSADELKKRCTVVRQKAQKAEVERKKREENERATLQALQGFRPILPKPSPVFTSQPAHASSSGPSSTAVSSPSPSNPLLLKFKLTASPLPPLAHLTPQPTLTRAATATLSSSFIGLVSSSAPLSSAQTASSSLPLSLQPVTQPPKPSSTGPTKSLPPQRQRYKPYPFLWEDRDVRKKVRGIAAALRRSEDEEADEAETGANEA
ncbi:hypothetical protein JCM8097_008387 [Rhodosporidiobolus ruineniae]